MISVMWLLSTQYLQAGPKSAATFISTVTDRGLVDLVVRKRGIREPARSRI